MCHLHRRIFITTMTAGAILGATAMRMMFMPEFDGSTKRRMRRTARSVRNAAEDVFDDMRNIMR
ncbi:YtxH domain-containing protein [Clostridium fermenticellae]|nr:YtxH domain-containing protein [Clostridium fermenticellae]